MKTLQQRFDEKYERVAGIDCWLWTGAFHGFGYGKIWDGKTSNVAHRVSYELHVGPVPSDACVLHRCDVPSCIRPDHLFLGTHQDNMDDMAAKNRRKSPHFFGETNPSCKITADVAEKIFKADGTLIAIGKRYGVSKSQVGRIKRGPSWKRGNG